MDFQPTQVEIEKFCQDILADIPLNPDNQYVINFVRNTDCGSACLDKNMLRSILNTLLTNAIKYSPQGGTIDFRINCTATEVIFQVYDQ
ncbi:hypothetical protein [Coleofasciculus sp.]|uniref:hypothetical protein n=1 Tax=Coleofasciculus sp. TaxID=3100458 RepID=UPI003A43DBA5